VGIAASVQDDAARTFAIGFYGGLAGGASIASAFQQARAAILLVGQADSGSLQLSYSGGLRRKRTVLAPPARRSRRYNATRAADELVELDRDNAAPPEMR
jgi:hypothetical protein